MVQIGVVILFGVVGVLILLGAVGRLWAWQQLRGTEAETPSTIAPGHTEIEGTAKPLGEALESPEKQAACVAYHHVVHEREFGHDHDEVEIDLADGPDHDDDDTGTEWEMRKNETQSVPFVLEGEASEVVVDPEGATFLLETAVSDHQAYRKTTVDRLDIGEPTYVAGEVVPARESEIATDGQQYVVQAPRRQLSSLLDRLFDRPFVLSDANEATAERRLLWNSVKLFAFAIVWLLVVGAVGAQILAA